MEDAYLKKLLGSREKVLLISRQHWTVLVQDLLPESLLILGILFLVTFIWSSVLPAPSVALAYVLLLLPLISLVRDVLVWMNHKYVVTNLRVIQLMGVLNKNVTDSSLEKVNDVKMEQSFLGRLLHFGDIEILTASELGVNRFTQIGHPVQFKTAMLNAKNELDKNHLDLLSQLTSLHSAGLLSDEELQQKKAAVSKEA